MAQPIVLLVLEPSDLDPPARAVLESALARAIECASGEDVARLAPGSDDGIDRARVAAQRRARDRTQRDRLVEAIEACEGNLAEVARRLQLSRGGVIYRARKFGLL